jgi:hypothetical protein
MERGAFQIKKTNILEPHVNLQPLLLSIVEQIVIINLFIHLFNLFIFIFCCGATALIGPRSAQC